MATLKFAFDNGFFTDNDASPLRFSFSRNFATRNSDGSSLPRDHPAYSPSDEIVLSAPKLVSLSGQPVSNTYNFEAGGVWTDGVTKAVVVWNSTSQVLDIDVGGWGTAAAASRRKTLTGTGTKAALADLLKGSDASPSTDTTGDTAPTGNGEDTRWYYAPKSFCICHGFVLAAAEAFWYTGSAWESRATAICKWDDTAKKWVLLYRGPNIQTGQNRGASWQIQNYYSFDTGRPTTARFVIVDYRFNPGSKGAAFFGVEITRPSTSAEWTVSANTPFLLYRITRGTGTHGHHMSLKRYGASGLMAEGSVGDGAENNHLFRLYRSDDNFTQGASSVYSATGTPSAFDVTDPVASNGTTNNNWTLLMDASGTITRTLGYRLSKSGTVSGGTFTITVNNSEYAGGSSQTTGAIAYDATNATIVAALEALSNVGAGKVTMPEPTSGTLNSNGSGRLKFSQSVCPYGSNSMTVTMNSGSLTGGGSYAAAVRSDNDACFQYIGCAPAIDDHTTIVGADESTDQLLKFTSSDTPTDRVRLQAISQASGTNRNWLSFFIAGPQATPRAGPFLATVGPGSATVAVDGGIYSLSAFGTVSGGTYTIKIYTSASDGSPQTTSALAYNADAAAIQAALEAQSRIGAGNVTVAGGTMPTTGCSIVLAQSKRTLLLVIDTTNLTGSGTFTYRLSTWGARDSAKRVWYTPDGTYWAPYFAGANYSVEPAAFGHEGIFVSNRNQPSYGARCVQNPYAKAGRPLRVSRGAKNYLLPTISAGTSAGTGVTITDVSSSLPAGVTTPPGMGKVFRIQADGRTDAVGEWTLSSANVAQNTRVRITAWVWNMAWSADPGPPVSNSLTFKAQIGSKTNSIWTHGVSVDHYGFSAQGVWQKLCFELDLNDIASENATIAIGWYLYCASDNSYQRKDFLIEFDAVQAGNTVELCAMPLQVASGDPTSGDELAKLVNLGLGDNWTVFLHGKIPPSWTSMERNRPTTNAILTLWQDAASYTKVSLNASLVETTNSVKVYSIVPDLTITLTPTSPYWICFLPNDPVHVAISYSKATGTLTVAVSVSGVPVMTGTHNLNGGSSYSFVPTEIMFSNESAGSIDSMKWFGGSVDRSTAWSAADMTAALETFSELTLAREVGTVRRLTGALNVGPNAGYG